MCNSSEGKRMVCVNGSKCVAENNANDNHWAVELEMNDLTPTRNIIVELSKMTGIDIDSFVVVSELDNKKHSVRIIVYVDDESTAAMIATKANDACESCQGVFCRCSAKIREPRQILSLSHARSSHGIKVEVVMLFLIYFAALSLTIGRV